MKRKYLIICGAIIVFIIAAASVFALRMRPALTKEYDRSVSGVTVHVTDDRVKKLRTYEIENPDRKVVWSFDDAAGTISLTVYNGDTVSFEKSIAASELDSVESASDPSLGQAATGAEGLSDPWWGYSFYYDTDSKVSDVYLELQNPNPQNRLSEIKLDVEYGSYIQKNAMKFMDCVRDMNVQQQLARISDETAEIIRNFLIPGAIENSDSLTDAICGLAAASGLTDEQVYNITETYRIASLTDSYYLNITG